MNLVAARLVATTQLKKQVGELDLTADFADEIVSRCTFLNYEKGSALFIQGSPADLVFYVFAGLVKIYCPRSNGSRILMNIAGPGDLIGYADFIDSGGRRAQVFEAEALVKTSVALFTRNHLLNLLQTLDQESRSRLIERVNTAWSSIAHRFGTFLGMTFKERLEFVLRELGEKFGVGDSRGALLRPELSHSDYADMIGSSRPMVSRLLSEMSDEGVLLRQGKQLVLSESFTNNTSNLDKGVRNHSAKFEPAA
jgi:CRP/FNR family cyclic AMP-dependent transcriptional regulator